MSMRHETVTADQIRLHTVSIGEGPLVLLVHGFPESWYSWRHQLPALAEAGYRAVAIDVRGYGRSSKPKEIEAYRLMCLAGDLVRLVEVLGEEQATLIGHDWGSPIVWTAALLRPDLFRGVAMLSVPYAARSRVKPSERFREMAGEGREFYIEYFQEPGRAEAEIEQDVRRWLLGFYHSASGDVELGAAPVAMVPAGKRLLDQMLWPDEMPAWLSEEDLDVYAGEFEHSGFTGGLNRYRNVDRDWEDMAAFTHQPITIPALFVGGSQDGPTIWGAQAIERFSQSLPKLTKSVILDGCGHWVQQERAEETNELLVEFLAAIHPAAR